MPCIRCTSPPAAFHLRTSSEIRHRSHTSQARNSVSILQHKLREAEQSGDVTQKNSLRLKITEELNKYSLSSWPSFLEFSNLIPSTVIADMYSIYTYEPLHNIHLGVSTRLKEVLIHYLDTDHCATVNGRLRTYSSLRHTVLKGCNSVLRSIQLLSHNAWYTI